MKEHLFPVFDKEEKEEKLTCSNRSKNGNAMTSSATVYNAVNSNYWRRKPVRAQSQGVCRRVAKYCTLRALIINLAQCSQINWCIIRFFSESLFNFKLSFLVIALQRNKANSGKRRKKPTEVRAPSESVKFPPVHTTFYLNNSNEWWGVVNVG